MLLKSITEKLTKKKGQSNTNDKSNINRNSKTENNDNISANKNNNANDSFNASSLTTKTNSNANVAIAHVSITKITSNYADNDFNNRRVISIADKNRKITGNNKKCNICFTNKPIT